MTTNNNSMNKAKLGGQFTFPGASLSAQRIGYGAMKLAGPGVWGRPRIMTRHWLCCAKRLRAE